MHGGFKVWILNGCGPNLCFPKAFKPSTRFPRRKFGDTSSYFCGENQASLALGDMNYDDHTERGEQIYIYIHHAQCKYTVQESKCLHPQSPNYKCRKINEGRHTLEMRTNGTWHDIPNTTHLRKKGVRKEREFKRIHNQMGEARPLNLLNAATWLISTCLHPRPFRLRLGDCAISPSIQAPCVYIQRQTKETSKQAMEGKDAKSI